MYHHKPTGAFFAHAFYSAALNRECPSSTYAFGCAQGNPALGNYIVLSQTANILWRGTILQATQAVKKIYPDAVRRGPFTSNNYLQIFKEGSPIPLDYEVIGPGISLGKDFENGPIKRIAAPEVPNKYARFQLVVDNSRKGLRLGS